MRGKLLGFSTERLFRFLNALGSNVEIRVIPNSQPNIQAQTSLVVVYTKGQKQYLYPYKRN